MDAGTGRGLLGTSCVAPDTDFWFPGASTAEDRQDYVHLANPDDTAAVVDIELYGKDGPLKSDGGDGITVPPHAPGAGPAVHPRRQAGSEPHRARAARSGRVGAAVQAADDKLGADWLAAAADPAGTLVLPGIPADATVVRLVAFATGDDDADLNVSWPPPPARSPRPGTRRCTSRAG